MANIRPVTAPLIDVESALIEKYPIFFTAAPAFFRKSTVWMVSKLFRDKKYAEQYEADGVQYLAWNIDVDFENCIDGFLLADIRKLKASSRKRYLGENEEPERAKLQMLCYGKPGERK